MSSKDHENEFPIDNWPIDLVNTSFTSLQPPSYLGNVTVTSNSASASASIETTTTSMTNNAESPLHGTGHPKRARSHESTNQTWSMEALISYVQHELAHIMARIVRLEGIVGRLPQATGLMDVQHNVSESREISRGHLDRYCSSVLEKTPDPPISSINKIAQNLEPIYRQLDRKSIISQIRKWFRKRREEMGSRIISAFRRLYPTEKEEELGEIFRKIEADEFQLGRIIKEAKVEAADDNTIISFTKQKIISYLAKRRNADS